MHHKLFLYFVFFHYVVELENTFIFFKVMKSRERLKNDYMTTIMNIVSKNSKLNTLST